MTANQDGKPTVHIIDYMEGVAVDSSHLIIVGHMQDEAHYVSLVVMPASVSRLTLPNGIVVSVNAIVLVVRSTPASLLLSAQQPRTKCLSADVTNGRTESICAKYSHIRDSHAVHGDSSVVVCCHGDNEDSTSEDMPEAHLDICNDANDSEIMHAVDNNDQDVDMMSTKDDQPVADISNDEAEHAVDITDDVTE